MREIETGRVTEAVRNLCIDANTRLPEEHLCAFRRKARRSHEPPWNVALHNDWHNPYNHVVWQL